MSERKPTNDGWKLALDTIVHGANDFDRHSTAAAVVFYDTLARLVKGGDPGQIRHNEWVAEVRCQQSADVIWSTGDTLERPAWLPECVRAVLVVPENTNLDSTAEVTQAALNRYSAITKVRKRAKTQPLGSVVACEAAGRFAGISLAVCREPGKPDLRELESCLRNAMRAGEYDLRRLVIPVWGREADMKLWADVLAKLVNDAAMTQSGVRLPISLVFRPQDEAVACVVETLLIDRGVLVARSAELASGPEDWQGPDAVFESVSENGKVTPRKFADWCARGVRLPRQIWNHHKRVWREANHG